LSSKKERQIEALVQLLLCEIMFGRITSQHILTLRRRKRLRAARREMGFLEAGGLCLGQAAEKTANPA